MSLDRNQLTARLACRVMVSLFSLLWTHSGMIKAEAVADDSRQVVEVSIQEITRIQRELEYLRARDAERQNWETSIQKRLPPTEFDFAGHRRSLDTPISKIDSCDTAACDCQSSSGAGAAHGCHCCRGGYGCQCPLGQAPCIQCPRVSTLNPYFNVNLFGALKLDMLFNRARPLAPGTPFFLTPDSTLGLDQDTFDVHARQSTLGAAITGPRIGSYQSGGLLMAMLYNDALIVDQYGFLPLQAYGELRNQDWRFAAGLQFDVFSPGLPTVLPFSALASSGNAGNAFRGQVRLERFLHPARDVQWTLQLALSEPISSTIDPSFRVSEDNGWPNVEARVAWAMGPMEGAGLAAKRPFEVGVSGVVGQIRNTAPPPTNRVVADVWGLGGDFRWRVNDVFGMMGEFFTGQGLGTYNGAILQTVNSETFESIRTTGGWIELFLYWTPCLHSHTGYGIDDPIDRDVATVVPDLGRVRNTTLYSNLIWDLNPTFRVGFEFTWRETNYSPVGVPDNEGAGFHTQFQWAF